MEPRSVHVCFLWNQCFLNFPCAKWWPPQQKQLAICDHGLNVFSKLPLGLKSCQERELTKRQLNFRTNEIALKSWKMHNHTNTKRYQTEKSGKFLTTKETLYKKNQEYPANAKGVSGLCCGSPNLWPKIGERQHRIWAAQNLNEQ